MKCDGCGHQASVLYQRVDFPATRDGRAPMLCPWCVPASNLSDGEWDELRDSMWSAAATLVCTCLEAKESDQAEVCLRCRLESAIYGIDEKRGK